MRKAIHIFVYFSFLLLVFQSCSPTKYVGENEYLLDKNTIVFLDDSVVNPLKVHPVSEDELLPILKQKPNRKIILGIRFHLRLYSLSNQARIDRRIVVQEEKAERKNQKIKEQNENRLAKGKEPKQLKTRKTTFGEGLRNSGEAPVILDSVKMDKSAKQISVYLMNKGFFNNQVTDSVVFHKNKKAEVIFYIKEGKPYKINKITYNIKDSTLSKYIDTIKPESKIKVGQNFDTDKMSDERERITKFLLNNGYHYFNKEFIYFRVDSSLGKHQVNVELGIQNYKFKDEITDSIIQKPHQQYKISSIKIYPDYSKNDDEYTTYNIDSVNEVGILHKDKLKFHTQMLYNSLLMEQGEFYSKRNTELTYKKFSSLGVFKAVTIQFDTVGGHNNELQAKIYLQPAKSQTFTVSTDGTNNGGYYGIEGSMVYAHKNLFGGAENLQISFTGGIEAQAPVTGSEEGDEVTTLSTNFNTIEFGPKVSLTIHRFLFLNKYFKKSANPQTTFTANLNYQKRPDFTRGIEEGTFGYIWHEKAPITYKLDPIVFSAIEIDKSPEFELRIDTLNDRLLAASYSNHIIAGSRLSFVYNGQEVSKRKNVFYAAANFETAGNLLRYLYKATNQPLDETTNSYNMFGIRFAQFLKLSGDVRYYRVLTPKSKVVYRAAAGLGIPLSNLKEALPFEKSFYSGGANGMRAWKARTLGPGAYYDSTGGYDKIGDIQLESNIEFRFPLISWIEGAWFIDAGNIWLINKDSLRPNAEFDKLRFISEIAFGTGVGLRADLDFFVIRFDFAMPFKNPALPVGQRWIFEGNWKEPVDLKQGAIRKDFYPIQFNLGIGYPF